MDGVWKSKSAGTHAASAWLPDYKQDQMHVIETFRSLCIQVLHRPLLTRSLLLRVSSKIESKTFVAHDNTYMRWCNAEHLGRVLVQLAKLLGYCSWAIGAPISA